MASAIPTLEKVASPAIESLEKECARVAGVKGSQVAGVMVAGEAAGVKVASGIQALENAYTAQSAQGVGRVTSGLAGASHTLGETSQKLNGVAEGFKQPTNLAFGFSMVGAFVGGFGNAVGWIGKSVGLPNRGQGFNRLGFFAGAVERDMRERTLIEMINTPSRAVKSIADHMGENPFDQNIATHLQKAANYIHGVEGTIGAKASSFMGTAVTKLSDAASHLPFGGERLGHVISSTPAAVSNIARGEAVYSGLYTAGAVIGEGARAVKTVRTFADRIDQICDLHADLTGVPRASVNAMQVMFSPKDKLPLLVQEAVDNVRSRIAPAAFMAAVSACVQITMARHIGRSGMSGGQGMGSMIAMQMGSSALTGMTMPSSAVLDWHSTMKAAYEATGGIPQNVMEWSLVNIAPSMQGARTIRNKEGNLPEVSNVHVKALAAEYVADGLTPTQVMNKCNNGEVAADLSRVSTRMEAQRAQAVATEAVPSNNIVPLVKINTIEPKGLVNEPQLAMAGVH